MIAQKIVSWQRQHGRHDLPWQRVLEPYPVWLSEIMLQQTQVVTVIPYFQRFMEQWPTVVDLASAPLEEVLSAWSGLGYYSRARYLHRCAQVVTQQYGGHFPTTATELVQLPGIGPSTAASIASLCFCERVTLFDGNVQRVLSRLWAFDLDLAQTVNQKILHKQAQILAHDLPRAQDMPALTQGLMDLGATVCRPRQPACHECPLHQDCAAHAQNRVHDLPKKSKTLQRKTFMWWLCMAFREDGALWLDRRPERGIWSGLQAPRIAESIEQAQLWRAQFSAQQEEWPLAWTHVLTHRDLVLHPCVLTGAQTPADQASGQWVLPKDWEQAALPAPVRRWLLEFTVAHTGGPF